MADERRIDLMPRKSFIATEEHTADSKWQYCGCSTCQEKRAKLEAMPGKKINWDTFRNKDENY